MKRALLLLVLCATTLACSGRKKDAARQRPVLPVRVLQVERSTFVRALAVTGEVFAPRAVTLSANVEGTIACCFWREGDSVTETQDVFSIDRAVYQREVEIARQGFYVAAARHADLQAGSRPEELRKLEQEILSAREKLDFATKDRDRTQTLYQGGSVSRELYEKAQVEYVAAKSRLETAENQLKMATEGATRTQLAVSQAAELEAHARFQLARSKHAETRITAPFAGTITGVHARPGDNAAPRMPLVDLADLSQLMVRFSVPESQSGTVALKQKVFVSMDAFPGRELAGEVDRIHPTLDPRTRVLWVEARLLEDVRLIPGMFARIRLILEELPGQIAIPESSLITRQAEHFVFVVEGGKTSLRPIKAGHFAGGRVQILSGLEPGSQIVMENADQLRDGQAVQVLNGGHDAAPGGPKAVDAAGARKEDPAAGMAQPMKKGND
jgi:multidrug efflux pump subunit AcrA (membrane-fusion protein)